MIIQALTEEHILNVCELEKECFDKPWSYNSVHESVKSGFCDFFVALEDSKVIGYCGMYINGDITNIAVAKNFRRKGVASSLLKTLLYNAKDKGVLTIYLEVRVNNLNAINLYEKHNFKRVGLRKKYYDDGEDALIYTLEV